jgi:hypothetical protein
MPEPTVPNSATSQPQAQTPVAAAAPTRKARAWDADMLRLRLETLRETQDMIKTADSKANFLVAFYTVVMFVAFPRLGDFWNWYVRVPGRALSILGFVVFGVLLLSLLVSIWHFKQCAWPRLDSGDYVPSPQRTTISWWDLASETYESMTERLNAQGSADIAAEVSQQLYVTACIARDKYYHVRQCYRWLWLVVLSFIGFMALLQVVPR